MPLIVISPYALKDKVTKNQYEFGSILKLVENTFRLKPLAASDTRAANFGTDVFNFGKRRERSLRSQPQNSVLLPVTTQPEPAARQ